VALIYSGRLGITRCSRIVDVGAWKGVGEKNIQNANVYLEISRCTKYDSYFDFATKKEKKNATRAGGSVACLKNTNTTITTDSTNTTKNLKSVFYEQFSNWVGG
jgi:hypothetical protein